MSSSLIQPQQILFWQKNIYHCLESESWGTTGFLTDNQRVRKTLPIFYLIIWCYAEWYPWQQLGPKQNRWMLTTITKYCKKIVTTTHIHTLEVHVYIHVCSINSALWWATIPFMASFWQNLNSHCTLNDKWLMVKCGKLVYIIHLLDRKLNAALASPSFSFILHTMALKTTGYFILGTVAPTVTASLTACDGYHSLSHDCTPTVSNDQTKCEINVK